MFKYITFFALVMLLVSCDQDTRQDIEATENRAEVTIESENLEQTVENVGVELSDGDFTAFEASEREFEGMDDNYVIANADWYNCDTLGDALRLSLSYDINKDLCGTREYNGNTVVYYVHELPAFEWLPKLDYSVLIFNEEKWYVDYIDSLYTFENGVQDMTREFISNFQTLSTEQQAKIQELSWGEDYSFPSETYSEIKDYLEDSLQSDISANAPWVQEQFQKVEDFVDERFN